MASLIIIRSDTHLPANLGPARDLIFGAFAGSTPEDERLWRRLWKRMIGLEPGQCVTLETKFPRSPEYHRMHFAMLGNIFDNQEQFADREIFRKWVEIGAGHFDLVPHPATGELVPIARSVDYASLDDESFRAHHLAVRDFLRTDHAQSVLWPHADPSIRAMAVEHLLKGS